MKKTLSLLSLGLLSALLLVGLSGCDSGGTTETTADGTEQSGDSHADDHDHEDGDDHGHGDGEHAGEDHDAEDHDHDFESLAEAVAEIESLRDEIRDGFKGDDPDVAHGPLHHIGEVLIATEEMVNEMDDSTENKAEIQAAVKTLLDEFTAVDNTLHGADDGKQYSEASESIDAAIETLKSNAK
jgi:hypothetical protein